MGKEELTDFERRVLKAIEESPNKMTGRWEIAWNEFPKEWEAKRSGHGAMIRSILQAGQRLKSKGLIVILPPKTKHDDYTLCSIRGD